MKTKSPLSVYGSDSEVGDRIGSFLSLCSHVTIPFFGGGGAIRHMKARTIVAADVNENAVNFHRVLSGFGGNRDLLISRAMNTLSHPSELEEASAILIDPDSHSTTMRAWAYWSSCWLGRKGAGLTKSVGGSMSVRWTGEGGNNASRITSAAYDLPTWAAEMKRCEWIGNSCFRKTLAKVSDKKKCGIYVDAPWYGAGRLYLHNFKEPDHVDLASLLNEFEHCPIVVRYGDCDEVRSHYEGWDFHDVETKNQSNKAVKEVLITKRVGR